MYQSILVKCHRIRQPSLAAVRCLSYTRMSKLIEAGILAQTIPQHLEHSCLSHKLMVYNGIIQHSYPGAFYILPIGLRVLHKLQQLIDIEMSNIDAQKIAMPCLTAGKLWKKSGRWSEMGSELFRLNDRHGNDYCLAPTHEEAITSLVSSMNHPGISYKRLPLLLYQITWKYRDEIQPKHGLLRAREFLMKDLYTFDVNEQAAKLTYDKVCEAYNRIFNQLQLDFIKVEGATGNIGGSLSHEYHISTDIGEDTLLICNTCKIGSNKELLEMADDKEVLCPKCGTGTFRKQNGIEVGHTFLLGTKYSSVFKANYLNEFRKPNVLVMGCYGLGVTRILAAAVEVLSDDDKIKWPSLIAPYQICIIPQKEGFRAEDTYRLSEELYRDIDKELSGLRGEIILDDRLKMSIGKRKYEASRLGIPYVIILGKQALEDPPKYELVNVYEGSNIHLEKQQLLSKLSSIQTLGGSSGHL
ncbi:putative proline--tRNA ligase, mitochondrial [Tubulanus polymorphus]|uniref:putative proline--tRNA ligase, mitochondrial n=1 Tax=Tubulanus polymorphus TaxID=672921 RepID=UPI003DA63ADC